MSKPKKRKPKFVIFADDLREGQLIPWFLMCSYAYYHRNISIISDTEFDRLCERLLEVYNKVSHVHKRLVKRNALRSTTGYYIRERDYPLQLRGAAMHLASNLGLL